jgi:hypothetical protein
MLFILHMTFEIAVAAAAAGLDLWKRNLQLLVPFLIQPRIQLMSISSLGPNSEGSEQIQVWQVAWYAGIRIA